LDRLAVRKNLTQDLLTFSLTLNFSITGFSISIYFGYGLWPFTQAEIPEHGSHSHPALAQNHNTDHWIKKQWIIGDKGWDQETMILTNLAVGPA